VGSIFDADFPGPGDVARWRPGCVGSCRFPTETLSPGSGGASSSIYRQKRSRRLSAFGVRERELPGIVERDTQGAARQPPKLRPGFPVSYDIGRNGALRVEGDGRVAPVARLIEVGPVVESYGLGQTGSGADSYQGVWACESVKVAVGTGGVAAT